MNWGFISQKMTFFIVTAMETSTLPVHFMAISVPNSAQHRLTARQQIINFKGCGR
jgi:hypothetical protein